MRNRPRLTPGRWRAVVYAVLVHVAIVAALVVGFRWNQSPPAIAPGKPIDAVVAEDPQKKKLEENRRRAEEQKQREEAARNQAEAEKKRQEQEARKRDDEQRRAETERKQVEVERQRQAETEKKRQTELKRQQEEQARRKQEEDSRRAEEKKRRENEARQEEVRKQVEAERRRKAAEDSLKQQLAAEEEVRAEATRAGRAATEMDKYREAIRQRVSNRWNEPSNVPRGLKCLVRVRFVPGTWDIVEVVIVRGSGNKIFDDSVERAVLAASPLPLPSNSELHKYFGELQFEFEPRGK